MGSPEGDRETVINMAYERIVYRLVAVLNNFTYSLRFAFSALLLLLKHSSSRAPR